MILDNTISRRQGGSWLPEIAQIWSIEMRFDAAWIQKQKS